MAVNNLRRMVNLTKDLNVDGDVTADSLNIGQIGGRRNIIINGAMQVAQRSTSVTGITTAGYYTADRYYTTLGNLGTWTQTQETDAPDGFASSLKLECTTADASPAAGDFLLISQFIEGQNLQHLKKGTSSAESVTASFWIKSNKTGTYIFELLDVDNSNRHINKSFTVDASGTWEYKTITFEGDTTGAFDNDNAMSLQVNIWLGGGSDLNSGTLQTSWAAQSDINRAVGNINLADTIGNYFQLTGFQLEVGETATPFEHRSYAEELALCQRYYQLNSPGAGYSQNTTTIQVALPAIVPFRTAPIYTDMTVVNGTNAAVDPGTSLRNITGINSLAAAGDVNGVIANLNIATTTNGKTHTVFGGVIGTDVEL